VGVTIFDRVAGELSALAALPPVVRAASIDPAIMLRSE